MHNLKLFGLFGAGVGGIVNAGLNAIVRWVGIGATALLGFFGHALNSSTGVTFGSGFMAEFAILRSLGLELVGGFVCIVIIQSVMHQDFSLLTRMLFIRLPAALMFSGLGLEIVSVLVTTSDSISAAFFRTTRGSFFNLVAAMSAVIIGPAVASPVISGFLGLLLALLVAIVVLLCWLELVVRAAAITVASLFIPLALSGLVWPATQRWTRRLAEVLLALILSKVVISAIFALAINSMGTPQGANTVLEGIALFILCAWAPFSLLKLIPLVEAGAIDHFGTVGHRGGQAMRHLGSYVAPIIGDWMRPAEPAGVESVGPLPWAPHEEGLHFEVDPEEVETFRFLGPWLRVREDASRERNDDGSYKSQPIAFVYETENRMDDDS